MENKNKKSFLTLHTPKQTILKSQKIPLIGSEKPHDEKIIY